MADSAENLVDVLEVVTATAFPSTDFFVDNVVLEVATGISLADNNSLTFVNVLEVVLRTPKAAPDDVNAVVAIPAPTVVASASYSGSSMSPFIPIS